MATNTVLIRGLDREMYNKVVARAKEQGKNVAHLINEAMEDYLKKLDGDTRPASDERKIAISGSVAVSKADLLGIHGEVGKFILENSGTLTLEDDIDREALHCLSSIRNTGRLRVPKDIHHLALLKAGHIHGEIEKY
jgi:predicted DNA-binding protein